MLSAHKANPSAGSQDQDDQDLFEDFPLGIQEVSDCVFHRKWMQMQWSDVRFPVNSFQCVSVVFQSQVVPGFDDRLFLTEENLFSGQTDIFVLEEKYT